MAATYANREKTFMKKGHKKSKPGHAHGWVKGAAHHTPMGVHHSKSGHAYKKHPKTGKWVRVKEHDRHSPTRPASRPGHHKKGRR